MTRKESEKDAERPHYYSQFWLDVAAGRRIIGAPRPNEEGEAIEPEVAEPAPLRRAGRSAEQEPIERHVVSDGRAERIVHPVVEPIEDIEELVEPEEEELETDEVEALEYQNAPVEDTDIPDMDLSPLEEEEDEEESFEDEQGEEEEEDEDDVNWARGRKKPKPSRPVNKPPVKKPGKRDTRRGY